MRVHSLNLPEDIKNIEILPLSDLHVGDASFDRECFLRYIRYVEAEPNRYILLCCGESIPAHCDGMSSD